MVQPQMDLEQMEQNVADVKVAIKEVFDDIIINTFAGIGEPCVSYETKKLVMDAILRHKRDVEARLEFERKKYYMSQP